MTCCHTWGALGWPGAHLVRQQRLHVWETARYQALAAAQASQLSQSLQDAHECRHALPERVRSWLAAGGCPIGKA